MGPPPVKKEGNFSLGGQILKVVDTIHWVVPGSRMRPCSAIDNGNVVINTNDCETFRSVSVITAERAKPIF